MARRPILAMAAFLLAASGVGAAEDGPARARELVREAADLTKAAQYDEALERLREAQEMAPEYAPTQSWLAHVYELTGQKEQALTHLAALLALDPKDEYAPPAIRRLFYQPPFPRVVNPAILAVSPIRFTVDSCALAQERVPGVPQRLALCYTTSPKFPEKPGEGGAVREQTLPGTGAETPPGRFNRVVYGYLETPGAGDLQLRTIAYYPSSLLSGRDADLAPLAQSLVHVMLRFQCYASAYLGLPPQGDPEGINRLWLCAGGESGAERHEADIFLYRVFDEARSPVEWVRQLAHECGHLLIPGVGGFAQPEVWGNGELGERLFIYFLSLEAARVAGTAWPSDTAAARLDDLWGEGHLAAEEYLASAGRMPLDVWAGAGPESELIVGQGERSMQYYVGFALYVLAAHGPEGLREVIKGAPGSTVPDFVYSYKQVIGARAADGPLSIGPGCYDRPDSKLTAQPPPAADLAPRSVTLGGGDTVTYPVFLPTGQWWLEVPVAGPTGTVTLAVSFDGGAETKVTVGAEATRTAIGPLQEGWHRLRVRAAADQPPLSLTGLVFGEGPTA
jgi:hypothetical protein